MLYKKMLIIPALVLSLMCTSPVWASGVTINQDSAAQEGNITVTYSLGSSYQVTIPDTVSIGENGTGTAEVTIAANPILPAGKTSVKVNLNMGANLNNGTRRLKEADHDVYLEYLIKNSQNKILGSEAFLAKTVGTAGEARETLTFALKNASQYSGDFTDTLTFTVSLK